MPESDKLKPIPTVYKGYRFRSRLEARWAVFFDVCGVKWEYEPEGYDLGNGISYLPDFVLHDVETTHDNHYDNLYVEVKGDLNLPEKDIKKLENFPEPLLLLGPIPDGDSIKELMFSIQEVCDISPYPFSFTYVDGDDGYSCLPVGITKQGVLSTKQGLFLTGNQQYPYDDIDAVKTVKAYAAARAVRFDHGEDPQKFIESEELLNLMFNRMGWNISTLLGNYHLAKILFSKPKDTES